jgi:hypothetical protein
MSELLEERGGEEYVCKKTKGHSVWLAYSFTKYLLGTYCTPGSWLDPGMYP